MADTFKRELDKTAVSGSALNKMDMLVSAMWEIMQEKGFTREELNAKLDQVREANPMADTKQAVVICPECGSKVTEGLRTPFEGKCIYCGRTVLIYPGDNIENTSRKDSDTPKEDDTWQV